MIAAIFDLDGTLYTGHIGEGIARHHRTHRVKRLQLYAFMGTHMPLWLLQRAGLISGITMRRLWARHLGWTVRGWSPREAMKAFSWIAEEYVKPRLLPEVMERLRDHQRAGHRVILVSGTLAPLLSEIGRQLGVEATVGTPLVVRDGCYTGASERPVCQGADKVTRLEADLAGDEQPNWSKSYAYADSITDLPLLEHVGHPVAVHPDPELSVHATRHGWEIIP